MAKMSKEVFKELVGICVGYDPFVEYIDDGRQYRNACEHNNKLSDRFSAIMKEFGIERSYVIFTNESKDQVEVHLTEWLADKGITLEEEVETPKPTKRQWTEEEIKTLVQTHDKVLYGALKNLYNCQTADEQASAETTHANGAGFNALDAEFLTSCAQFLIKNGFLTDKQKAVVRRKLVKYNKQLTRLANA